VESDGKNENFERPILIIKKFNGQMFWGVPLTSKERTGDHYFKVSHENGGVSWVCLSQIKTMSSKRLLRKIGMIPEPEFNEVVKKVTKYLEL
jgi:mRNA interferase MazF